MQQRSGSRWCAKSTVAPEGIHNQSGAALPGHKSPNPLHRHAYPQAGLSEELEMHRRPSEPGQETAHLEFATLHNREPLPQYSHVTFVKVTKWTLTVLAGKPPANQLTNITSLLHRDLSDAR
jgi:hypothetical protein